MRVLIRENAAELFHQKMAIFANEEALADAQKIKLKLLKAAEGRWLDVWTDRLYQDFLVVFLDSSYTLISTEWVELVEDDVRPNATWCNACGRTKLNDSQNAGQPCPICGAGIKKLFTIKGQVNEVTIR